MDERAAKAAEIERRLNAGEELQIGDLMILFGKSRSTIHRWITNGADFGDKVIRIRHRVEPGPIRLLHPDDVKAILAETRRVRGGDEPG